MLMTPVMSESIEPQSLETRGVYVSVTRDINYTSITSSFQSFHPLQSIMIKTVIKIHEIENLLEFIFQFGFLQRTAVANLCD